jgi:hypothetical protein
MTDPLLTTALDATATPYATQALSHSAAAFIAHGSGHGPMWRCYFVSPLLYVALAACHFLHL